MVIYADTSFIFSLYVDEEPTEMAKKHARQLGAPLIFTPLHRLELRTALRCRLYRGTLTHEHLKEALRLNEEDVRGGLFSHTPLNWSFALREAERIGEKHVAETGVLRVICFTSPVPLLWERATFSPLITGKQF